MIEMQKKWVGSTVDGRFSLQSYLGGSDHSAVFLTSRQDAAGNSHNAAIKLIPAAANADAQLQNWQQTSELSHPNLIRVFEAGRCDLDGTPLLYVVEECAEENLAQILPDRVLTAEEAKGMLPSVLRALQFVHAKGLVHGRIQPSNILAMGEQVKLSTDSLSAPGEEPHGTPSMYDPPEAATGQISTAADIWQLGMTIVEVLTQHLPSWDRARGTGMSAPEVPVTVPEPFRAIAVRCLQVDPEKRLTIREMIDGLETGRLYGERLITNATRSENASAASTISSGRKAVAILAYLLGAAAVAAIAFVWIAKPKSSVPTSASQPAQTHSAEPETPQPAQNPATETSKPSSAPPAEEIVEPKSASSTAVSAASDSEGEVVQRVLPQVSPSARRTIHGKIKVRITVDVDPTGNVVKAKTVSSGPSRYFSHLAAAAAKDWKFAPAGSGDQAAIRKWNLEFAFSRAKTEATVIRVKH
jgi:TonB family protein